MIQTVWVQNPSGDILDLNLRGSGDTHGLLIFNMSGLGPPKANINGQGGPNFDGVRVNSTRVNERHITLTLAVQGNGFIEETAKDKIYTFFPIKKQILLGIETDTKDVYVPAIVESNEFNQFAKVENAVISLYCSYPYFIDLRVHREIIRSDAVIPLFEFPFENASMVSPTIEFGYLTTLPTVFIDYRGEVETGADFILGFSGVISGDSGGITITNQNSAQQMTIDVSLFGPTQAGDQIFINTRVGQKSIYFVRNSVWTNILNSVGINDDWIQLRPGNNTIIMNSATGIEYIETEIIYRSLREGV